MVLWEEESVETHFKIDSLADLQQTVLRTKRHTVKLYVEHVI